MYDGNYFDFVGLYYEPETEHEYTAKDRQAYFWYLWEIWCRQDDAREALRREKQIRQEAKRKTKGTFSRTPRPREAVPFRVLLSTFEEARSGHEGVGPEPRDQEVQRTTHGAWEMALLRMRKGVQSDTTQTRGKHWHGGGTCCNQLD